MNSFKSRQFDFTSSFRLRDWHGIFFYITLLPDKTQRIHNDKFETQDFSNHMRYLNQEEMEEGRTGLLIKIRTYSEILTGNYYVLKKGKVTVSEGYLIIKKILQPQPYLITYLHSFQIGTPPSDTYTYTEYRKKWDCVTDNT